MKNALLLGKLNLDLRWKLTMLSLEVKRKKKNSTAQQHLNVYATPKNGLVVLGMPWVFVKRTVNSKLYSLCRVKAFLVSNSGVTVNVNEDCLSLLALWWTGDLPRVYLRWISGPLWPETWESWWCWWCNKTMT